MEEVLIFFYRDGYIFRVWICFFCLYVLIFIIIRGFREYFFYYYGILKNVFKYGIYFVVMVVYLRDLLVLTCILLFRSYWFDRIVSGFLEV